MIGLLQRVSQASVTVDGQRIAEIGKGLLVLVGVEQQDDEDSVDRLLEKTLNYRVFADQDGKMNLSLRSLDGGLLLVPQFTLAATTTKGRRPSFARAAPPEEGKCLFESFIQRARDNYSQVQSGEFGADMQVSLTNDGPVTFWLQV